MRKNNSLSQQKKKKQFSKNGNLEIKKFVHSATTTATNLIQVCNSYASTTRLRSEIIISHCGPPFSLLIVITAWLWGKSNNPLQRKIDYGEPVKMASCWQKFTTESQCFMLTDFPLEVNWDVCHLCVITSAITKHLWWKYWWHMSCEEDRSKLMGTFSRHVAIFTCP